MLYLTTLNFIVYFCPGLYLILCDLMLYVCLISVAAYTFVMCYVLAPRKSFDILALYKSDYYYYYYY